MQTVTSKRIDKTRVSDAITDFVGTTHMDELDSLSLAVLELIVDEYQRKIFIDRV